MICFDPSWFEIGYAAKRLAVIQYVEELERDCAAAVAKVNDIRAILQR